MFTENDIYWLIVFALFLLFVRITWGGPARKRISRSEMIRLIEKIIDEKD